MLSVKFVAPLIYILHILSILYAIKTNNSNQGTLERERRRKGLIEEERRLAVV